MRDNRAGGDDRARANRNAAHDPGSGTNPAVMPD